MLTQRLLTTTTMNAPFPTETSSPMSPISYRGAFTSSERFVASSEPIIERPSEKHLWQEPHLRSLSEKKLRRLLDIELEEGIAVNLGLIEAVFPSDTLPFKIDNDLLRSLTPGSSRSSRSRTKTSNILINHPDMSLENDTANWLNEIGDILRRLHPDAGRYQNAEGKTVKPPKRIWKARYSSYYLEGSNSKLKPDLILVDEGSSLDVENSWPEVHALGEITRTVLSKNTTIKNTIYQKSFLMFTTQANRGFSVGLMLTGSNSFAVNVCDRSGAVRSPSFEIVKHPLILLRVIAGLLFARPGAIGYDETMQCGRDGKATIVSMEKHNYIILEELFSSEALRGRATKCWRVKRLSADGIPEGEECVMKDSWADKRRTQNEVETLKHIQELGLCDTHCLPRYIAGGNVPLFSSITPPASPPEDCTSRRRAKGTISEARVHRRLVMGSVGKHITDFESVKEVVGGIIDTVKGN